MWQIDGGGTYYGQTLYYTFPAPGNYKVKMTSIYGSCSEVKEKEIPIGKLYRNAVLKNLESSSLAS